MHAVENYAQKNADVVIVAICPSGVEERQCQVLVVDVERLYTEQPKILGLYPVLMSRGSDRQNVRVMVSSKDVLKNAGASTAKTVSVPQTGLLLFLNRE